MVSPLADFLATQQNKTLLRFLTCGSVDDGKSTLIGRLLFDSKLLFEDHLIALKKDSQKFGTNGNEIDYALLVDGLEAEREQGITIDVAYRFFATEKRKFIVTDTPGHEQYTRNMATGASNAELAVILVDARKGVLTQTRRHACIVSLLGIRKVVLAVNKCDLVGFSQSVFEEIARSFSSFAAKLAFDEIQAIPMSAREGDNVFEPSVRMPWYDGPTLSGYLDTVEVIGEETGPLRFPVQWVNRPHADFRGFCGTLAGGKIARGDNVIVAGSGAAAIIDRIIGADGDVDEAVCGDAVTLTLDREIDISRGDTLCTPDARPEVSDQFAARLLWLADEAMLPGRSYLLKLATAEVPAQVTELKAQIDVNSLERLAAKTLKINEIGVVNLSLSHPVAFDPYKYNHVTGGFILIDRTNNATVGAGFIDFSLRRASNVHWQALDVNKVARSAQMHQKPVVLWFTGLSGAGKSTVANMVEQRLFAEGRHTYILDGDNIRHGLNRDLGFTDADRVENIRRVAETAKLFVDAGLIVLVSFISPFRSERRLAREMMGDGEFIEIFVDTSLQTCIARDAKGLYKKALAGEIRNFTGIDSPYEPPTAADITLNGEADAMVHADAVVRYLRDKGYLG